jgi:hypothetical protein
VQPLIDQSIRGANDFTGSWYVPGDSGWGLTLTQAQTPDGKLIMFAILYYPDALGQPRWAFAQSNDYRSGQTIPITHRRGYCRSCPVSFTDIDAGSMTLTLDNVEGLAGQNNRISLSVDFKGAAGGRFTRSNAALIRLVPRPAVIQ